MENPVMEAEFNWGCVGCLGCAACGACIGSWLAGVGGLSVLSASY